MRTLWGRRGHARVDYGTAPALYVLARRAGLRGTPLVNLVHQAVEIEQAVLPLQLESELAQSLL